MKMNKFQSIISWINEQEENTLTYGCVMLDCKIDKWEENHLEGIDERDLYIDPEDDDFGYNEEPHVTLLYGIHEDEIDPEVIMEVIKKDMKPVTVTISEIDVFENDEYDVVKYNVPVTKQLRKYRNMMENFPYTDDYPEYKPHITIAYVKSGEGMKYKKKLEEPFEVTFDKGVYSFHETNEDGEIEEIRKQHIFPDENKFEVNLDEIS